MDRWEYKHVWITTSLGREGEDVEESAMATLNRHGAAGPAQAESGLSSEH